MNNVAVFYGSSTGNTETVAKTIADRLNADIFDVADNPKDKLSRYRYLVFGSSTWGVGDLQDDWYDFIEVLKNTDLENKTIALFGLGDSVSYPDSFVDAMGTLYDAILDKGCNFVGFVGVAGYNFDFSSAVREGEFVGLPLDEDNESNLTNERIDNWIIQLKSEIL